jgi:nucleoside-diphosphate-sugar epimerase
LRQEIFKTMQKILITGASGFVGRKICNTLHSRSIPFIAAVRDNAKGNQFKVGNLTDATKWTDVLYGCDVVIHLAARVHVMKDNARAPLDAYRAVNVDATMNLARQAVEQGIKRFIFVSSVKVNGEMTTDKPFCASDRPAPVDPYGQSKFEAECALRTLSRDTGLELVIVRPPLVYGPGVRANFLKLMQFVKLGLPLPFGMVQNRRSMVSLNNLIDLLILCIYHPNAVGKVFMVSDDDDLSLPDLILLIAKSMGKNPIMVPVPVDLMMVCARIFGKTENANRLFGSLQVDITNTKECLGWQPVESVETAVKKTVSDFLEQSPGIQIV